MYIPSITTILGVLFLIFMGHSMYQMTELFTVIKCTKEPCYTSFLLNKPRMQLALFTSIARNPIPSEVKRVHKISNFDYGHEFHEDLKIDVPLKTRRNGTLYMQVVLALAGEPLEWRTLRRDGPTVVHTLSLTEYMVPRAETFNLLGDGDAEQKSENSKAQLQRDKPKVLGGKPLTHIRSHVYVNLLTDNVSLSDNDVPGEMAHLVHVNRYKQILPILKTDVFDTRLKDLIQLRKNNTEFTFTFHYRPMTTGKLRLMLMMEHAMNSLVASGIAPKVLDEVKDLLSGANVYILCCTFFISTIHLFFDFLSLKNDVSFWRKKRSYEGLSLRTTIWRAFSQIVIFLYLYDENTSQLVLIPAGMSTLIELWKCKKILRIELSFSGIMRKLTNAHGEDKCASCIAEQRTEEFDKQGMRYLNYLLLPLCIGGAAYSLIYQPHRSWYSWTINSLVNGVYAFGFLFMLPQLFVNYKLKSVAALPWRAFMYKAFNTFIDDFFAFIITMPTAHRVACLRDDVVFLIYLYQRWLYPVDKKRIDIGMAIDEEEEVLQADGGQSVGNKQPKKKKRD